MPEERRFLDDWQTDPHASVFEAFQQPSLVFLWIYQSTTTNMKPTFVFLVRLVKHNLPTQPFKSHIYIYTASMWTIVIPEAPSFNMSSLVLPRGYGATEGRNWNKWSANNFLSDISQPSKVCPAAVLSASQPDRTVMFRVEIGVYVDLTSGCFSSAYAPLIPLFWCKQWVKWCAWMIVQTSHQDMETSWIDSMKIVSVVSLMVDTIFCLFYQTCFLTRWATRTFWAGAAFTRRITWYELQMKTW